MRIKRDCTKLHRFRVERSFETIEIKTGFLMGKFIDEVGATRHAMSDKELNELYKRLENFIADCTIEEAKENRDAFVKVETLIHQRIRENKK